MKVNARSALYATRSCVPKLSSRGSTAGVGWLALEGLGQLREKLLSVLQAPSATAGGEPANSRTREPAHSRSPEPAHEYLQRVAVESRGKIQSIPVDQIEYIVQSGPYAELHSNGRRHLIREAMQTLEERLDPDKFMRIHRSMIVRLSSKSEQAPAAMKQRFSPRTSSACTPASLNGAAGALK